MKRLLLWGLGAVVVAGAGLYTAYMVSPWPGALIIRSLMNKGGEQASEALQSHVPTGVSEQRNRQYGAGRANALDVFYPARMAQRILGMGDISTLVEKAQAQFDEAETKKLEKKIRKNQFDFEDFKQQLEQIKKMGNIKDLLGMIPGVGKAIKDVDISDHSFKGIEAIINSMTPFERANPDVINQSRRTRIAAGSGKDLNEINAFLKQFERMKQMMKTMNKMPMGGRLGFGRR